MALGHLDELQKAEKYPIRWSLKTGFTALWSSSVITTAMQFPMRHYSDIMMGAMAFQIASLMIVCSAVHSGVDQRKHQSSASLAVLWGIHRWPVNSPPKGPVTRKTFPFDDVIMGVRDVGVCWTGKKQEYYLAEVVSETLYPFPNCLFIYVRMRCSICYYE